MSLGTSEAVWGDLARKPATWYGSPEGRICISNILSWQSPRGAWPKNVNTTTAAFTGDPTGLQGTFDNGATMGELRFLAAAVVHTGNPECRKAVERGLRHLLEAQYPTGGWPQFYPPGSKYHRHITFNDGSMVRILQLLREVAHSPEWAFAGADTRTAAKAAFERGIGCILKSQIVVRGKLTAWCAQHDELDLRPRPGRSYELVSLSGAESAGILQLLMSLEDPSPAVVTAVQAAAAWYESARIAGLRQTRRDGEKIVLKDPSAPPLWARFYEIESNRPIFSGRDGMRKYDLMEIEPERRNGYAWYGPWGEPVLRRYAEWRKLHP